MTRFLSCLLLFSLIGVSSLFSQTDQEAALADQYFLDGEFESSLELYQKLVKNDPSEKNLTRIVGSYEALGQFDDAIKFLDKSIRKHKDLVILPIMKSGLLEKTGNLKQAEKLYGEVIEKVLSSEGNFIQIGSYLYQKGKLEYALATYLQGAKKLKREYAFSSEIANIYKQLGEYDKATRYYLNLYAENASNLSTVKLEILNMVGPDSQDKIEETLLKASDKNPNDLGLRTILYEFYVLAENFFEAFVQVKSIDRLFNEDGERVYAFAETMRNNKRYSLSNKALDYLIDRKEDSRFFYQAHMAKAINGELKAFDQLPVDMLSIRQAVQDYETLLIEFDRNPSYFEAIFRQANLQVFYLFELETALKNLNNLVSQLPVSEEWARTNLLLGDIHLMQEAYTKSRNAYTEVSEAFDEGNPQIRALAKYKLAQLSYYKGEFNLSEALLSAIKDNTSNDISNDAIRLNLTILDNTGLDTTTTALEIFASAQLLSYQRKYQESLELLDSLAFEYPNHSLSDEIMWEKVNIFLKQNNIELALQFIDRILESFIYDIYGDDALYTKARIHDYTLNDPENAMKYYLELLTTFPGSLFSVEARKRIRDLRKEG